MSDGGPGSGFRCSCSSRCSGRRLCPVAEDEADEAQQQPGGQDLGAFSRIIGRGGLNQVDARHIAALRRPLQDLQHIVRLKAAVAIGAGMAEAEQVAAERRGRRSNGDLQGV